MGDIEYKTVPLPSEPRKFKGLRSPIDRASRTLTEILNEEAKGGWAFVRAERMELEVRKGMLRRMDDIDVTLLIFSRERVESTRPQPARRVEPQAAPQAPEPLNVPEPIVASNAGSETSDASSPPRTAD